MKQKQIRWVVLLGAITIIGIVVIESFLIQSAWNIKERQFVQSVTIALQNVAERMSKVNQTASAHSNPVRQLSTNYFVVDINSVIDANVLEYYLRNEFDRMNLSTDFEYAIYNCQTDKMEYGNYITKGGEAKSNKLSANLPKYDQYTYYFGVNFPLLRNTISGDMTIWYVLMILLLLAIVFFVYAIFVILQQKRYYEMQKDFINTMTHEFKTPISSINLSAEVLMNPAILQDPSRLVTYGRIIKQENNRMNQLVDKVLQVARLENKTFELHLEQTDAISFIRDLVERNQIGIGQNLKIELELAVEPVYILCDPLHFANIFHNLFDNAAKYAGPDPIIWVDSKIEHEKLVLSIRDNGPGIPANYQKRIFHKFYRIPTGNRHDVKGFGLGLYYVRSICQAHHWGIRLLSGDGCGAFFKIEIPILRKTDR